MAMPPPTDPRASAPEAPGGLAEARDPRSQTGVSPHRLRHLIGRLVEVAVLVSIDAVSIGVAIFSYLALSRVYNDYAVMLDVLWQTERAWLPFVLLVALLIFARNGLYRPRETRPGGAKIVAGLFLAMVVVAIFSIATDNDRFTTYLIFPYTFLVSALLISLLRGTLNVLIDSTAWLVGVERRVLVVGEPAATRSVEAALRDGAPGAGLRMVAHVDDIDHLADAIAEHSPHDVVLARPPDDETMLIALEACRPQHIRLRVVPTAAGVLAHHADEPGGRVDQDVERAAQERDQERGDEERVGEDQVR
ncbi:MAG: nucleoside-diphosphate sugar epimerase/dehydratase, partial [Actinomycetota bacterium]